MSVQIVENMMNISWLEPAWKEWQELHDSAEMKELININNKKMQQSVQNKPDLGKGKGTGKAAST